MNKYKYLLKNIGVLTIANLGSKIISVLIVPLYTSIMTTSEYGTYDLLTVTVSLLVPILTLNLSEGLLRFCLDKTLKHEHLIAITLKIFAIGLVVLLIFININYHYEFVAFIKNYSIEFVLFYIVTALLGIITCYARGIDKVREVAISGVIGTIVTIGLNLIFLLYVRLGLKGYIIASIIGPFTQCLYLIITTNVLCVLKKLEFNKETENRMLVYSVPLIANSIAWWINNASDRYIVVYFEGVKNSGIYSMAYKIPSLLTMINVIFNQAWVLSSVKEFDSKDTDDFFSNTYKMYNIIMIIACSFLIIADKLLAFFLFKNDFYYAYEYVPFLLISVVFGAMSGYMGGIFSTVKRTSITAWTVGIGAIINFILNIILVQYMGTIGAAIATTISYASVWGVRLCETKRIMELRILYIKDALSYLILLLQAIVCVLIYDNYLMYFIEFMCFIVIFALYREQIKSYINIILKLMKGKVSNEQ